MLYLHVIKLIGKPSMSDEIGGMLNMSIYYTDHFKRMPEWFGDVSWVSSFSRVLSSNRFGIFTSY